MGCGSSSNVPPAEHVQIEVGKGGSTITFSKGQSSRTNDESKHAAPDPEVVDMGKGGSLILCNHRIHTGDELDWEPGEPIQRPLHPQSGVVVEHTGAAATLTRPGLRLVYGFFSEQGCSPQPPQKPNQDSLIVTPSLGGRATRSLFGVFDGHGPYGEHASHFCRTKLGKVITEHHAFPDKPATALAASFPFVHSSFTSHHTRRAGVDPTVSGTTAVVALVDDTTLHLANCGDSRAILITAGDSGAGLTAEKLSRDHKPSRKDERDRVMKYRDAKVYQESQLRANGDRNKWYICRTNDKNRIVYGVMFTRSIGDADATQRLGIVPEPEMHQVHLDQTHRFLVLATDGVWDVMSNQDVAAVVAEAPGPQEASFNIVQESIRRWEAGGSQRRDDITAVVVGFNWSAGTTAGVAAADETKLDSGAANEAEAEADADAAAAAAPTTTAAAAASADAAGATGDAVAVSEDDVAVAVADPPEQAPTPVEDAGAQDGDPSPHPEA